MRKKSINFIAAISTTISPVIFGIINYQKLPSQLAIHFSTGNQPDNFAPKALVVFGIPILMLVILLVVYFSTKQDNEKINSIMIWIIPVVTVMLYPTTILIGLGQAISVQQIVLITGMIILVLVGITYFVSRPNKKS